MARQIDRLSSAKVKNAKPGLHPDGGGLYLQVTVGRDGHLNKSWVFRFARGGHERRMGLGSLNTIGLGEARIAAESARKKLMASIDPIEERDAERASRRAPSPTSKTFEWCATCYIAAHEAGWRNAKHRSQWRNTLRDYAYPVFGSLPVDRVDTALVMQALTPLWADRIETGTRVRNRIEAVLDWARVNGYREGENPARWRGHLDHLLVAPSKAKKEVHHPAMPYADVPAFMARLRDQDGLRGMQARMLEFVILTAARAGEASGARWAEVDLKAKLWTIPGERMKGGKQHIVPLSQDALTIVESMKGLDSVLVFPGRDNGRPYSPTMFSRVLQRMGVADVTTHGFRSSFRDWAGDCTDYPRDLVEMALAHAVESEVEAAYRRSTAIEKRRKLMDSWARFCTGQAADNVVPLHRATQITA